MKRIAILGSTGSIGRSALAVIDAHPDRLQVAGLAAGGNSALLAEQIARYRPAIAGLASEAGLPDLRAQLNGAGTTAIVAGAGALTAVAAGAGADIVLCASSGTAALEAVLAAIEVGTTIALANKEVLVMAGAIVMDAAARRGVTILPVDSEHNAIHQCLAGRPRRDLRRLILTASGGPFRSFGRAALERVTAADALRHPTWAMGRKITIDSATLMNKGLEVIEAHWLFGVGADEIDVVVHPQSIVHSMIELTDGSILAQLGVTDMRLPIQYAFSYPERWTAPVPPLGVARLGALEFAPPDLDRFPCLRLAFDALARMGAWPIVLNAANEVAVEAFLAGRLAFPGIPALIEQALVEADRHVAAPATLDEVRAVDAWAHDFAAAALGTLSS